MSVETLENGIRSIMGFNLPCRCCGDTLLVDQTQTLVEKYTNKNITAYFAADARADDKAVGYSEGTGDSFECKRCHAVNWRNAPETIAAIGAP